jgi:hypothetical protein
MWGTLTGRDGCVVWVFPRERGRALMHHCIVKWRRDLPLFGLRFRPDFRGKASRLWICHLTASGLLDNASCDSGAISGGD